MYFHKVAALFYLAAAQSSSAQLYAITTPGLRGRQLQIPNCGMTLTVGCKIVGSPFVADSCEDIFIPQNQCGDRRVRVTYKICNDMTDNSIRFDRNDNEKLARFNAESFESEVILDDLAPEDCRTLSKARTFNTCDNKMLFVRSKMEGWVLGTDVSDDSKWCFQYIPLKILKPDTLIPTSNPTSIPTKKPTVKPTQDKLNNDIPTDAPTPIVRDTERPTQSLTDSPTKQPTNAPTEHPTNEVTVAVTEIMTPPKFRVEVACFGKDSVSSEYTVRCNEVEVTNDADCTQTLKYIYSIINESDRIIINQGIVVRDGRLLREIPTDNAYIVDHKYHVTNDFVEKDLCDLNGKQIKLNVAAMAGNLDGEMSVVKSANYNFIANQDAPLGWVLNENVSCIIDEQTCEDYARDAIALEDCIVDVVFEYEIMNDDFLCKSIDSITASMNDDFGNHGFNKDLPLASGESCRMRKLCPGDLWVIQDKRKVNFCEKAETTVVFDVSVNDKDNVNPKERSYTFPSVVVMTTAPTPAPSRIKCLGHPSLMIFEFQMNQCPNYDESQGRKLNGRLRGLKHKHSNNGSDEFCTSHCKVLEKATVKIIDADDGKVYYRGTNVKFGDSISISNGGNALLGKNVGVTVTNPNGKHAQEMEFLTTCSNNIYTGDNYGALRLVGWVNSEQKIGEFCDGDEDE